MVDMSMIIMIVKQQKQHWVMSTGSDNMGDGLILEQLEILNKNLELMHQIELFKLGFISETRLKLKFGLDV